MSASISVSSVVLSRYASAFVDLAENDGVLEAVQKDIYDLESMLDASEDLRLLVNSPMFGKSTQSKVIADISKKAKFNKLTVNFLKTLVENRRMNALGGIIKAFHKDVSSRRGEITVHVETAEPLTKKQEGTFKKKVSDALGVGVLIETSVDPEILGGMIVTVGSHMIDDSVRRKLERLGATLVKGANQNMVQDLKEVS